MNNTTASVDVTNLSYLFSMLIATKLHMLHIAEHHHRKLDWIGLICIVKIRMLVVFPKGSLVVGDENAIPTSSASPNLHLIQQLLYSLLLLLLYYCCQDFSICP